MAKNLILFRGNLERTIARNIDEWKRIFIEKYGDMNIVSLSWGAATEASLRSELLSPPFLAEKRLIVLTGPDKTESEKSSKKSEPKTDKKVEVALDILSEIPDSNFVIFRKFDDASVAPILNELEKSAMMKTFALITEQDRINYATEKLTHLERAGIMELVRRCGDDVRTFEGEVEKLLLVDEIDLTTIKDHILENTEVSVFRITDALLSGNPKSTIDELRAVLVQSEIRIVFSTLLSGLRSFVFYRSLGRMGIGANEAIKMLAIRDFVAAKYDRVSPGLAGKLEKLFQELVEIERLSKVGGLP